MRITSLLVDPRVNNCLINCIHQHACGCESSVCFLGWYYFCVWVCLWISKCWHSTSQHLHISFLLVLTCSSTAVREFNKGIVRWKNRCHGCLSIGNWVTGFNDWKQFFDPVIYLDECVFGCIRIMAVLVQLFWGFLNRWVWKMKRVIRDPRDPAQSNTKRIPRKKQLLFAGLKECLFDF